MQELLHAWLDFLGGVFLLWIGPSTYLRLIFHDLDTFHAFKLQSVGVCAGAHAQYAHMLARAAQVLVPVGVRACARGKRPRADVHAWLCVGTQVGPRLCAKPARDCRTIGTRSAPARACVHSV